jgi:hypothetical protein
MSNQRPEPYFPKNIMDHKAACANCQEALKRGEPLCPVGSAMIKDWLVVSPTGLFRSIERAVQQEEDGTQYFGT